MNVRRGGGTADARGLNPREDLKSLMRVRVSPPVLKQLSREPVSRRLLFSAGERRESERGHTASRPGRASVVRKFLRATASKNVLDRVSPPVLRSSAQTRKAERCRASRRRIVVPSGIGSRKCACDGMCIILDRVSPPAQTTLNKQRTISLSLFLFCCKLYIVCRVLFSALSSVGRAAPS